MARGDSYGRTWPAALTITIVFAVIARIIALGRWPGINADEAWYGANIQELLAGRAAFLHTGVGNPLNPIHSGPLALLLSMFGPSPALLRVPEVIWGLCTVLLAYPLLTKPLGRRTAHFVVMLLALSPGAVAYARFGWDPSGTPFVSLLAVGFALRNQPVMAAVCSVVALMVHPTNIFLLPIVAAAWGPHGHLLYRDASPATRKRLQQLAIVMVVVAIPLAWWTLKRIAGNPQTSLPPVADVIERVFSLQAWDALLLGVAGLFSGATTMTYIGGPLPIQAPLVAALISGVALVVPLAIGWRAFRSRPHAMWLLAGVGLSLAAFHVVAGPGAVAPGLERYALFLLVPLTIVCAIGFDALAERQPAAATMIFSLTYACFVAMLCGGYFYPLAVRGGESDKVFRTGEVEPKLAAYQALSADSATAEVVRITAEDWWLYWPLRYFAGSDPRVHVELMTGADAPGGLYPSGSGPRPYPHAPDKSYVVVFENSEAWARLRTGNRVVFTAFDPLQRPILHVLAVASAPE